MKIIVHIKDKQFEIECNDGVQKVKWLGDVAIFRYSHFYQKLNSVTKMLKLENGDIIEMNEKIQNVCIDNQHVWVVITEEFIDEDEDYQESQHHLFDDEAQHQESNYLHDQDITTSKNTKQKTNHSQFNFNQIKID